MKNKSKLISIFLLLILITTSIIGCSNQEVNDENQSTTPEIETESSNKTTDVVVIGAGGAGLAAGLEAHNSGKNVIIVEKMPVVGGNTLRATGGLNAAGTSVQKDLNIEDTVESHFSDTMKGGYDKNDPNLVKIMTEKAAESVEWLISLGADLSDVGRLGGASNDRAHRPTGGSAVGSHIIQVLKDNVEKENIELLLDTEAIEILYDNDQVQGIIAKDKQGNEFTIESKAVVIATGGFGANPDMITELNSSLEGFGTTNHPGATGDGIKLATDIGASTIQMDEIQTHPTVVPNNGVMITEAVRGNGAILINREGNRFINEIETRDVVSEAILKQEGKTAFLFFDDSIRESLSAIDKYVDMGLTIEGESIEEIAKELGVDESNLKTTLDLYNSYVDDGNDKDFQRPDMPRNLDNAKFYAIEVAPAVHHTMGGLKINENTEVLNEDGEIINGLFAAGEVTGGIHGGNRLGGNALTDIIVFGRQAGLSSAKYIK